MKEKLDGWTITVDEDGPVAQHDDDAMVSCWLSGGSLSVHDDESYYPGGAYAIPLTVIDRLRALENP